MSPILQASLSVGVVVVGYIVHQKKQPFLVPLHMRETTMKSLVKTAFPSGKAGALASSLLSDGNDKPRPGDSVTKSKKARAVAAPASDITKSESDSVTTPQTEPTVGSAGSDYGKRADDRWDSDLAKPSQSLDLSQCCCIASTVALGLLLAGQVCTGVCVVAPIWLTSPGRSGTLRNSGGAVAKRPKRRDTMTSFLRRAELAARHMNCRCTSRRHRAVGECVRQKCNFSVCTKVPAPRLLPIRVIVCVCVRVCIPAPPQTTTSSLQCWLGTGTAC